jgi:outer membrane receptor protein involved in Fe transport
MQSARFERRSLLAVAVTAVLAQPWFATEAQEAAPSGALEEIIVTGSRIARPDFESASPIVTLPQERFTETGSNTVETVLNSMPQFVPAITASSNNPSNDGQANVSLRGLDENATLTLLDGRRIIPATGDGIVDLNIIPPNLVDRVEVITGGASAVYGSDAMAGVVNFRLKEDFRGLQFGGRWSQTDRGDGDTYEVNATGGMSFGQGRGSLMGSVSYSEREIITQGERDFSKVTLGYVKPDTVGGVGPQNAFLPSGSTTSIEEGRVTGITATVAAFNALMQKYGYAPGTVPRQTSFSFNQDRTLFTTGDGTTPGSVANFRGEKDPLTFNDRSYSYNFAPPSALLLPLERTTGFLNGTFEFGPSVEAYLQALYGDYSVKVQAAPTPLGNVFMPATNPFIPADLKALLDTRATPSARVAWAKRVSEVGPRIQDNQYDTLQVTAGLRGDVLDDWKYDAYVQFGESDQEKQQTGNVRRSKVEELTYAADGGVALCGGFDPFGLNSISDECVDYISVDSVAKATVKQSIAEVSLSGPIFELPAGSVDAVFGVFYKKDEYKFRADDVLRAVLPDGRPDVAGFNATDNVDGDDHNTDLYTEILFPLLSGQPGAESLEAVLGYRYSDYASAGGVDAYKAELLYQPISPLRFRGSYQRAVRAASVYELYLPQVQSFATVNPPDPCSFNSTQRTGPNGAQVAALCVAQGLPAALLPTFTYTSRQVDAVIGGNPGLDPEEATTYTLGVVFTSPFEQPWLEKLQVSLDWYDIEVENEIAYDRAVDFIPRCYNAEFNPSFSPDYASCQLFQRSRDSGEIQDALELYQNVRGTRTSGVDLQIDWNLEVGPGLLGASWLVAWVDSWERQATPQQDAVEFVGTINAQQSIPEWKWNLNLNYSVGGMYANVSWRYIDSMVDATVTTFEVPNRDYFDATVGYEFDEGVLDGLSLRAGVENLTDEDPPIFPSYQQANTDPTQYDVLGRRYYLGLDYRF